jgi:hypothetical protein
MGISNPDWWTVLVGGLSLFGWIIKKEKTLNTTLRGVNYFG